MFLHRLGVKTETAGAESCFPHHFW